MATVPTLLVGLGGIGSRIADSVFGMVPEAMRDRVGIHAFDTNVNDISKLAHLGSNNVTQTSSAWSVRQYLQQADDSVKEWFPFENTEIQRKLLNEGAGQVRSVSRLGYRAAIEDGKLEKLEREIARLLKVSNDGLELSLRIMIVSSLAGGTGAGLFLQTALFLRDLVQNRFQKENVLLRGAFILPDILVGSRTLDEREWPNVRANAYACLKELNAVMGSVLSKDGERGVTIELEYKPNQVDAHGRKDHAIPKEAVPYEFAFLYDFENAKGDNIGSFTNYFNQVVNSTYLQLFSPISGDMFSVEDNQIRELVRHRGMNRFCSSGVAKLIYPYQDMLQYCALHWVTDTLSDKWLNLSKLYDDEHMSYERDKKVGLYRDKPEIKDRYPALLKGLGTGEKPDRFFKLLNDSLYLQLDKGALVAAKHEKYLEALDTELWRLCHEEASRFQFALDEGKLKIKEQAANEIASFEANLEDLKRQTLEFIGKSATFLLHQSIIQDSDETSVQDSDETSAVRDIPFHLNIWILGKNEPMHPVAVRAFLYLLETRLDKEILELTSTNSRVEQAMKAYMTTFDDPDTAEVESAEDMVKVQLNKGFFVNLFKRGFKEFIGDYKDKAPRQRNRITEYRSSKLKEIVYTKLRGQIQLMSADWELYFSYLASVADTLKSEQLLLLSKHDASSDPTVKFVYASKDVKGNVWDSLKNVYAAEDLPTDIARSIYVGQYKMFCATYRGEAVTTGGSERIPEMFRRDVVVKCFEKLKKDGMLDLDVITALRKQGVSLHSKWDATRIDSEYVANEVSSLLNLAQPFGPVTPESSHMVMWGLYGSKKEDIPDFLAQKVFFGNTPVIDHAFSKYEIICYHSVHGLLASDFPRFYSGDNIKQPGSYYRAYHDIITGLNTHGNEITPHLDKRWHLPNYMPDLNVAEAVQDRKKVNRALILGIMFDVLTATTEDGKQVWMYFGSGGREALKVQGKTVEGIVCLLHDALASNPSVVDRVLDTVQEKMIKDRKEKTGTERFYEHGFIKGLLGSDSGILDILYTYPDGEPGNEELPDIVENELRPLLVDEIADYCKFIFGIHRINLANTTVAELINTMKSQSRCLASAPAHDGYVLSWLRYFDDRIGKLS